jgi:hypothetical protein
MWEKSAQQRTEKVPQPTSYPRHGAVPIALACHFDLDEAFFCSVTPKRVFMSL